MANCVYIKDHAATEHSAYNWYWCAVHQHYIRRPKRKVKAS